MKTLKLILVPLLLVFAGCHTIYLENGSGTNEVIDQTSWHNNVFFGLVEISAPEDVSKVCAGKGWQTIRTQETFVQGLLASVTYNLFAPVDFGVKCGGGKATAKGEKGEKSQGGKSDKAGKKKKSKKASSDDSDESDELL